MSLDDLTVKKSEIFNEVLIIQPSIFHEQRGNIFTSYHKEWYGNILPDHINFIHDKFAESRFNVLRGLHGDNKTWKLVSCVWGEIFEVVVDMRKSSKTFKKWDAFSLKGENYTQVLIPPNFVNGYYVMSEKAMFHYKLAYSGDYIDADKQMTVKWDDPELGIKWPCKDPILQSRDS